MADDSGKMTMEERQKIVTFLSGLSEKAPTCEFCGSDAWNVGEHLVQPFFFGTRLPNVSYPQFMVSCINCGNTKFFSVVKVPGLLPAQYAGPSASPPSMQETRADV